MSLVARSPQPTLAWQFQSSNVDSITGLAPTTTGGTPAYVTGKYGQAINFPNSVSTGTTAPISYVAYTVSLNATTGFTVAFWVNFNIGSIFAQTILSLAPSGAGRLINIYLNASNILVCYDGSSNLNFPAFTFSSGTWYHIALVVVGGNRTVYINGNSNTATTTFTTTSAKLYIGGDIPVNNYSAWCSYDDLRIYGTSLTSLQVQSIYAAGGMPSQGVQILPAPLDTLSASGAYSTRLLRSAYTGPVVNVRRNSDNATLDFIADQFGNLSNVQSAVTIDTWLASTTGNVTTWYDQAYSNNFTQSTAVSQPQIVKNGGKWVLFFNRDTTPTFYSNLQLTTSQTGIYSIVYNANLLSTYNAYQTLLGQAGLDNFGFRFDNNLIYGDSLASRYGKDFLAAAGSYWYLNGQYGNMTAGGPGVPSVVNPAGNNGVYTSGVWNHVIGVENGGMDTFQFNAISAPLSTLIGRSAYGYIAEVIMFRTQLSDAQARSLYANQYISRQLVNYIGAPLFSQLSPAATSSAVGAFSLRAVNGTTAKAVQVRPVATLPSFTNGTSTGSNAYSQSLTGYAFGLSGTYVATGSSIFNTSTTPPWKAFDSDITTWWETTAGQYNTSALGGGYLGVQTITIGGVATPCEWLQIQLPTGIVLTSYSMYARSGFTYRMPKNFVIAGSNDGATWTAVDTQTNQTTWTGQTPITFNVTSSTAYKYFAICVTAIPSSSTVQNLNIGQWTLNGTNVSWQTDFYADRLGNLLTAPVTGQLLQNWLGGSAANVVTWYDQSPRGRTATGTRATLTLTSNLNQQWAINTTNGGFNVSGGTFLNGTDFTITCTTKRLAAAFNDGVYGYGANSSWVAQASVATTYGDNTRFGLVMPNSGSSTIAFNDSSYQAAISSAAGTLPTTYVGATEPVVSTAVTFTNTSQKMYVNGSLSGTTATLPWVTANASTIFTIGTINYYGGFAGEMSELLIFTSALGTSDISTLYSMR